MGTQFPSLSSTEPLLHTHWYSQVSGLGFWQSAGFVQFGRQSTHRRLRSESHTFWAKNKFRFQILFSQSNFYFAKSPSLMFTKQTRKTTETPIATIKFDFIFFPFLSCTFTSIRFFPWMFRYISKILVYLNQKVIFKVFSERTINTCPNKLTFLIKS